MKKTITSFQKNKLHFLLYIFYVSLHTLIADKKLLETFKGRWTLHFQFRNKKIFWGDFLVGWNSYKPSLEL